MSYDVNLFLFFYLRNKKINLKIVAILTLLIIVQINKQFIPYLQFIYLVILIYLLLMIHRYILIFKLYRNYGETSTDMTDKVSKGL